MSETKVCPSCKAVCEVVRDDEEWHTLVPPDQVSLERFRSALERIRSLGPGGDAWEIACEALGTPDGVGVETCADAEPGQVMVLCE